MRYSLIAVAALTAASALTTTAAFAGETTSVHTVQTQLSVDTLSVRNERLGSSATFSGENIGITSLGQLGNAAAGTASAYTAGVYTGAVAAGASTQFSESVFLGSSATAMTPTVAAGLATALGASDIQTVSNGGIAGTLAGTNGATGAATITAGGAGTDAIITRSLSMTVFN